MQPSFAKQTEIRNVIKRDGRIVAFNKEKIVDAIMRAVVEVGGNNRALAEALTEKVCLALNVMFLKSATAAVEEIQDVVEKTLVENGHYKTAKAFILYRAEHARMREGKDSVIVCEDNIPYKMLWKVFTWNTDHSCDTIEKINNHITNNTFSTLIDDAEKLYHNEIGKVASKIMERGDSLKLVIVAGPSSSGKTTTTMKIGEKLKSKRKEFVLLNLDNYFLDLKEHPRDEYGDYDYESPQAMDLELINNHLSMLLNGQDVEMPIYDFKLGKRIEKTKHFKLQTGQILLIDSLHGLYPELTNKISGESKFKFYIESLCQIRDNSGDFIRWSDLRMLRRMVRDSWHRGYDPEKTVGHWHYVRRSEKKHIVPFINKADYVFNGALPYELPVYKKYLFSLFPAIIAKYEKDPKKLDAYIRAKRVFELLKQLKEVKDEKEIPLNSLVREFIGGSSYEY